MLVKVIIQKGYQIQLNDLLLSIVPLFISYSH